MSEASQSKPLSKKTKFFYGIGDLGNAVVNSAVQFFLMKFYTDGALVAPALAGNALLIGKFWDAINDPLFGWLTDRTKSRFGKRRVFMIFGAIPLAISIASQPHEFSPKCLRPGRHFRNRSYSVVKI